MSADFHLDPAREALATAAAELHELRTENMRLRHQARETAAIHDRLAAELVTVQASTDRLLAQCVRQRALFDDLRACPTTIAVPGSLRPATMSIRGRSWWRCPGLRGMRCTPSAVSRELHADP